MTKTLEEMILQEEENEEIKTKKEVSKRKQPKLPKTLTYEQIKEYLDIPANQLKQKKEKKENGNEEYQIYKAYERKISWINIEKMKEDYLQYKKNPQLQSQRSSGIIEDEKLNELQLHMRKGKKLVENYHRKRVHKTVDVSNNFINKQNEYFNKYVNKAYDHYSIDIKDILEHN